MTLEIFEKWVSETFFLDYGQPCFDYEQHILSAEFFFRNQGLSAHHGGLNCDAIVHMSHNQKVKLGCARLETF